MSSAVRVGIWQTPRSDEHSEIRHAERNTASSDSLQPSQSRGMPRDNFVQVVHSEQDRPDNEGDAKGPFNVRRKDNYIEGFIPSAPSRWRRSFPVGDRAHRSSVAGL